MKYCKFIILLLFCALLMNFQCDNDDVRQTDSCDGPVLVDNSTYQMSESSFYIVITAIIEDDCLNVNISSSGCDGSTWELALIDSEDIVESMAPQRYLKLILVNNEDCLAVFNKEQSFDLSELRIDGVNQVILNIEDFPEALRYSY